MQQQLQEILSTLNLNEPTSQEELFKISRKGLPEDYMQFISESNGGEGFIGKDENYIILYTAQQVQDMNPYYEEEFAKRVTVIGSDGGGRLYGFDPVTRNFFDGDPYEFTPEEVHYCGPAFLDFIDYLANKIL